MPALTVFSSIVGTTMGRTSSAVPYTYLKRGVYYFGCGFNYCGFEWMPN